MAQQKKNRNSKGIWSVFALIIAGVLAFYFPDLFKEEEEQSREGLIPVELVRAIDGDTIKIKYEGKEQNVRYLLIDTPETNHRELGNQPFGDEASARNAELVTSGELAIEFDEGDQEDKYGRLLAYVYVDGRSVQEQLVAEGLARVAYVFEPNTKYEDQFRKAESRAEQAGIGIWSVEGYVTNRGFKAEAVK